MPLIPESNALMLAQNFDSLDTERQAKAREILRQYRDQQDELGLPEWPSQSAAEQESKTRLRGFFEDLKTVDAAAPSLASVLPYSKNPDADRARVANTAYMASRYGKTADEVGSMYDLYRDDLAARIGGKPGLDDLAFHSVLKGEVEKEKRKEQSFQSGAVSAVSGKPALAALAEWQAANPDAKDDTPLFMQAFTTASSRIRPHLPMVKEIADAIEADMNGKGDAKVMQALSERLVEMSGKDRRMVIAGLRMEAESRGKGAAAQKGGMLGGNFWQQVGESAGRFVMGGLSGTSNMKLADGLKSIPETGSVVWTGGAIDTPEKAREFVSGELSRSMSEQVQTAFIDNPSPVTRNGEPVALDAKATNLIREAKARVEKRIRVAQEMAALGSEIDPLPSVVASTLGTSGALLGGAILTRGMSAPMAAQLYAGTEYEEMSRKFPMMGEADKQGIAALSGSLQAGLDLVGVKGLDKLPAVQTLLKQGLTRAIAGRAAGQFGKSFVVENLVEGAQDLATPTIMAALASDVPGYDWNSEMKDWWKNRADVAVGLLPLTLLGVGAVSARDALGAQSLLGWDLKLASAGVLAADRTKITELARNGDVEGAQAVLKEAWSRRSPKEASEFQAKIAARDAEAQAAFEEAARIGLLPTIRRDSSGYTVTNNVGESVSFGSWQDARDAASEGMTDVERSGIDAIAAMADHFLKSNPNEVFEFKPGESMTLKGRVASGELSAEEATHAAIVAGQLDGMTKEEAQNATWTVLGNNRVELAENVRRSVSTIFNGGNVLTAVEEPVEGRWKAGIASGRYTREGGIEWVRLAEQATGEKFLPDGDISDRALIEAISKIVVADVFGRRKDGSRIAPGAVTMGVKSALQQSAAARGLSAFLRAFRAFFGQVFKVARALAKARKDGKLSADWESQLDELLGIDSQQQHETEAAKEADAIANEALYAGGSSYSETNPGPNGETFSITPAQDAKYLAAVEAGDMEKAQRMVNEQNAKWGAKNTTTLKVLQFATRPDLDTFLKSAAGKWIVLYPESLRQHRIKTSLADIDLLFDVSSRQVFNIGDVPYQATLQQIQSNELNIKKPLDYPLSELLIENVRTGYGDMNDAFGVTGTVGTRGAIEFIRQAKRIAFGAAKRQSLIGRGAILIRANEENRAKLYQRIFNDLKSKFDGVFLSGKVSGVTVFGFIPSGISSNAEMRKAAKYFQSNGFEVIDKSYDAPVVTDDAGNVIPLSQRFNPADDRITFNLRKFDFSSRLAPAAETLAKMRQGGKAFDFASIYKAASVGQSSSMLPLDRLFDAAKKQNPALTEADFGKQIQALYDSGGLMLEPGESPDSMRESLARFGVRDSLGVPAMFAGVMETFSMMNEPSPGGLSEAEFSQLLDEYKEIREKDEQKTGLWMSGPFWHVTNYTYSADSSYVTYRNVLGVEHQFRISNHEKPPGHSTDRYFRLQFIGTNNAQFRSEARKWIVAKVKEAPDLNLATMQDVVRQWHVEQVSNAEYELERVRERAAFTSNRVSELEKRLADKREAFNQGIRIGNGKPFTTENQREQAAASIAQTEADLAAERESSKAKIHSVNQEVAEAEMALQSALAAQQKSQSRAESGSDMLGRGSINLASSKTGEGDSPPSAPEVNSFNPSRASDGESFNLRKFDFSSRLAPAAETLAKMRQAGKAFDFAAIYKAASVGQSSSMLPLSRLFDAAKKQNPALTEADFGKQIQALYDSGGLMLEPGESPDSMRESLARFGVRDSLGVPAMFAGVMETFSMMNEPSPGGLSEAESIRFDKFSKEWAGAPPYAKELLLQTMRGWAEGGNNRGKEISTVVDPIAGLFPEKQRERIKALLTAHANSAAAIYNDAGGRIHLEQGVSKKLLTWADRVWRFFAIGSSLAPPHFLKEKIAKTGSRYYSDASGRMIFRLSDHQGGMWDGNAFISSKLGEDAPFDLRPLPDEDFHQLARRILRYAALNDEAAKVSQGGFQKQESSEASAFGGTWPQNGEPAPPEVNSFNPSRASGGTSFSIRPGNFASRMDAAFSPFQRSPELRMAIAQVAKQRAQRLGAEWIEKAAVLRSARDIGREQRFREADGFDRRMQAYLDSLTPSARQELEFEPAELESDPLVSAMLDFGKLMSQSTAKKLGKVEVKAGDYDGAPWLPPAWYSKGSGIMPDVMAQAMHDQGLLPDANTDTLWSALSSRIEATRKNKATHREAVKAYQDAKKAAKADAKLEAEAWANQARKEAGSPKAQRDMLKAALRTLDGILSAAPAAVRVKVGGYVKMAGLATDEAMLDEIERRIEKLNTELEKWLKKEAASEIRLLLKQGRPDMSAGKKGKGKDADMHTLFSAAEAAADMDALAVAGRLADLDTRIASGELTPEQEALAMAERGIVELVGDLDNADSGRAFSALDSLREIYTGGWLKWKLAEIERKERRAGMRQDFITATGKSGVGKERDAADKQAKTLLGMAKAKWLSLSSFGEVLRYAFGEGSLTNSLIDGERMASNLYEDANQQLADEVEKLFESIAGSRLAGEKLRFEMAQKSIITSQRELSQLEAIQALLMWRQEDGRRHMEGTRDENGKVTSKWSYDQAWIDEIDAALTPEARRVMGWIMTKYGAEHATLNPLYRTRYGVNLPQHDNYAPLTVKPMQTKAGEVVDPVTGAAVSGSGSILTPGSLRTRSRSAIAEPDFRDALQTFLGHSRQLEFWKAYYDLAVEANAVLGNREVMNAVHAKGGPEAATALRQWIDAIAQGGFRDVSARLDLMRGVGRVVGRASGVALLGRASALLVQSTQLAAASVQMPVTAYLTRFARLFTGGLNWSDAIRSDFIQRRFKTAPPIVRQAMDGLASAKPNAVMGITRTLGNTLSGADALFTAGTYAMLLDFHRSQGAATGLSGAELEAYATREAERATEQVAQPTRMTNRSLAEITSTHPLGRIGWAFASESRQKVALAGWALANAGKDPARAAKAVFLTFIVGGMLSQIIKNALRELKGDDDKNLWSPARLAYAATVAPMASAFPLGSLALGDSNMLSNIQRASKSLDDGEVDFRDIDTILSAAGLFNDTAAGLAQLSHLGMDAAKILQNLAE